MKPRAKAPDFDQTVKVVALVVAVALMVAGPLVPHWPLGFYLFAAGLAVLAVDYLSWYTSRKIEQAQTEHIIEYVLTSEENWNHANRMMKNLTDYQVAYDVSSVENQEDFDKEFVKRCAERKRINRIVACNPVVNSRTADWLRSMIDPECDTAGHYNAVRAAVRENKVKILHLPYPAFADFFVVDDARHDSGELVLGFLKEATDDTYNTGFRSTEHLVARDFAALFQRLNNQAQAHLAQVKAGTEECPICSLYAHQDTESLRPPLRLADPQENGGDS